MTNDRTNEEEFTRQREMGSTAHPPPLSSRPSTLSHDTVERLKDLVRVNQDSAKGFETTADQVKSEPVARLMRSIAAERRGFAGDLRQHVQYNKDEVTNEGSVRAKVHRWWVNVRGTVQDGDLHAMLSEAEKAEDVIKGLYQDVLKETSGSPVHSLLQSQYESIRQGHDRIRDLRDGFKKA